VRFGAAAALGLSEPHFADARAYLAAAETLARTGTYPDRTDAYFFRPPAYPVFLAAVTLGHPERIALAKAAGAASGALVPLLLAALAARLFGSPGIAALAGVGAALDPSLILLASDIQSEAIFVPLLLASGLALLGAADRPSPLLAVAAGALLGAAALARPSALAVAPLLAAPFVDRRWEARMRVRLAGSALLGLALALVPWTARNALRFHELIVVSDSAAAAFYDGNSDRTLGLYEARTRQELEQRLAAMDAHKLEFLASLPPAVAASPSARSRALERLALAELTADPGRAAKLYLRKVWEWWRPYPSPLYWPWPAVAGVGLLNAALYALGGIGLARASRRGAARFALAFLLVAMVFHVAFIVVFRYRVPFWDPVLLLYGASAAGRTLAPWRRP